MRRNQHALRAFNFCRRLSLPAAPEALQTYPRSCGASIAPRALCSPSKAPIFFAIVVPFVLILLHTLDAARKLRERSPILS